jgi:hypothetical protein
VAGLSLSRVLPEFPEIELEKIEYLTNFAAAKKEGVKSIPTLKSGDKLLGGFLLTKKRIREFLASL